MAREEIEELNGLNIGEGFLADVEAFLVEAFGNPEGKEIMRKLCEHYQGREFKVPGMTPVYRKYRNDQIIGKFTGSNYEEISIAFKLSVRHIRRVITGK